MSHTRSGRRSRFTRRIFADLLPTGTRRARRFSVALLSTILTTGCATFSGGGEPSLDETIEAIVSAPPLDQVHWGIMVLDPARNQVVYARNPQRKFVPASNMKVLSTATALSLLGPDFRLETSLWSVGELDVATGRLTGDLVLRPSGDPTFSETFYPRAEAPLDSLAEAVYRAGVRSVSGTLVLEASAWDSTTVPGSWMVGNLSSTSGATGSALAIANGEIAIEVVAGEEEGAPARTRWWPGTPEGFLSTSFVTGPRDGRLQREFDYLPESRRLKVGGQIPLGAVDTVYLAQRAPESVAAHALLRAMEARGIQVEGGLEILWDAGQPLGMQECVSGRPPRNEDPEAFSPMAESPPDSIGSPEQRVPPERLLPNCPDARKLASVHSPPMGEIVQAILEPSQNWMTEQLVHVLGLELGEEGSWEEGFRVEEEFLFGTVGVDSLDLHFRDGSGLSAYNLVTPRAMVRILEYMMEGPNGQLYRHAMAEPGEDGSTLRSRLEGLEGQVYGKTGTISHVNSLSGYLVTRSGRELIFSILTNGSGLPSGVVRAGIDEVVRAVARR